MPIRPTIAEAKLAKLRPTQMTVGLAEVDLKRHDWREVPKAERERFLVHHAVPAVKGPEERFFIVDHHHLGRALIEEDVELCFVSVLNDLSGLAPAEFWVVMDHNQWVHPYDAEGRRRPFEDMPRKLTKLADDPYRSLAAQIRRQGGFAKETEPFAEFLWADFFRRRIPPKMLAADPDPALQRALSLCHEPAAEHLPGWSGVSRTESRP